MAKNNDGEKAKTYGVGPSAEKKNVGQDINAFSRQDEYGKVYEDGDVVFDPTDDAIEIEQEDNAGQDDDERVDDGTKESEGRK
jgi:hypothetical protein